MSLAGKAVTIKILGDVADLKKKMGEAEKSLGGLSKAGGGVSKGLLLAGGAAVAAGTAVAGFAASSVGKFSQVAGETSKLIRLTGDTAENMSGLRYAASQSGIGFDALTKAIGKSAKSIMGAKKEEDKATAALMKKRDAIDAQIKTYESMGTLDEKQTAKLGDLRVAYEDAQAAVLDHKGTMEKWGVTLTNTDGTMRPMKDLLLDLSEQFKNMPGGVEKDAMAMEIFGKSGTDLLPFLNKGKEGLSDLVAEADKYGLSIGQDAVDANKKNVLASRKMKAAMDGVRVLIGGKIMPILADLTGWIAEHLPTAMAFFKKAADKLTPVFQLVHDAVKKVLTIFSSLVLKYGPMVERAFSLIWGKVSGFVSSFLGAKDKVGGGVTKLGGFFQNLYTMAKTWFDAMKAEIQIAVAVVLYIWDHFGERIVSVLRTVFTTVWAVIQEAVAILTGVFSFVKSLLTGKWGEAWSALVGILKHSWRLIWTVLKGAIKIVGDVLMAIGQAILLAGQAALKAVVTAMGWLWDKFVEKAKGIATAVGDAIGAIPGLITGLGPILLTAAESAGKAILRGLGNGLKAVGGFLSDIGGAIKGAFIDAVNFVVDLLNNAIPNDISWGPFSLDLPDNPFPHLSKATGGPASGMVRVGERGPENIMLPRGSWVTPAHQSGNGSSIIVNVAATNASAWTIGREVAWAAKTSGR